MQAAIKAEVAAKDSLDLFQKQLSEGLINQVALLNAQQIYFNALITRVQAGSHPPDRCRWIVHGAWWQLALPLRSEGLAPVRL